MSDSGDPPHRYNFDIIEAELINRIPVYISCKDSGVKSARHIAKRNFRPAHLVKVVVKYCYLHLIQH